mmetsp:Transcript_53926/g.161387  ORF Transcript_53926/g.161387 Transcript_53926/m.161387 type:complete len:240 (-) Transcript_53926:393-1112(-)
MILESMSLVHDEQLPLDRGQLGVIVRDEHLRCGNDDRDHPCLLPPGGVLLVTSSQVRRVDAEVVRTIGFEGEFFFPEVLSILGRAMIDDRVEVRPGGKFAVPVLKGREGGDDEVRSPAGHGRGEVIHKDGGLDGLPQTHLIRQDRAPLIDVIADHPAHPLRLIIPQPPPVGKNVLLQLLLISPYLLLPPLVAQVRLIPKDLVQTPSLLLLHPKGFGDFGSRRLLGSLLARLDVIFVLDV